jgi:hypothetical protein
MKSTDLLILGLIAALFICIPVYAEEKCDKKIIGHSPPASSYRQVSSEQKQAIRNYTSSDQTEICITLQPSPVEKHDKKAK